MDPSEEIDGNIAFGDILSAVATDSLDLDQIEVILRNARVRKMHTWRVGRGGRLYLDDWEIPCLANEPVPEELKGLFVGRYLGVGRCRRIFECGMYVAVTRILRVIAKPVEEVLSDYQSSASMWRLGCRNVVRGGDIEYAYR